MTLCSLEQNCKDGAESIKLDETKAEATNVLFLVFVEFLVTYLNFYVSVNSFVGLDRLDFMLFSQFESAVIWLMVLL